MAVIWLAALWETRNELRRQALRQEAQASEDAAEDHANKAEKAPVTGPSHQLEQLFRQAQRHYLQADWIATQQTLGKLLRLDRTDVEAQLLLATTYRASGDNRRALRFFQRLERRADAEGWQFEIRDELTRLATEESTSITANAGRPSSEKPRIEERDTATTEALTEQLPEEPSHRKAA